jgi:imidazole glycerol phosphate synthase subunit HisF
MECLAAAVLPPRAIPEVRSIYVKLPRRLVIRVYINETRFDTCETVAPISDSFAAQCAFHSIDSKHRHSETNAHSDAGNFVQGGDGVR